MTLAGFVPPPFTADARLGNNHVQTIWGTLFPRKFAKDRAWAAAGQPWRLTLPDGDVLTGRLHLHPDDPGRTRPTVLLLHGLEGDADAHYMQGVSRKAFSFGWHSLRLNFRGCGEGAGLAKRPYHGLAIADVDLALRDLLAAGTGPITAMGVSLGANKLLKLVASYGENPPERLAAAVAISPPIDYILANEALGRGLNLGYDKFFLARLRKKMPVIAGLHPGDTAVAAHAEAGRRAKRLRDFDAVFTAPMGGFTDAFAYYQQAGAGPDLGKLRVPTLIVAAEDDPFIPFSMFRVAAPAIAANPCITPLYTKQGGHVGFMAGSGPVAEPWMDRFWFEDAALLFMRSALAQGPPEA